MCDLDESFKFISAICGVRFCNNCSYKVSVQSEAEWMVIDEAPAGWQVAPQSNLEVIEPNGLARMVSHNVMLRLDIDEKKACRWLFWRARPSLPILPRLKPLIIQ